PQAADKRYSLTTISMHYRFATTSDAKALAPLNLQLIRDEGHRNPMHVEQLAHRMEGWLAGEYEAVIFEESGSIVGYALFRRDTEHVYLRELFVLPEHRRSGVGRAALQWLWLNAWQGVQRLRVEVLVGNSVAREFWRSVGFSDYCVTMEAQAPNGG
ncbi:MAG: N-acetyltransferase family protein, partial [Burkholderiales bacterium]